MRGVDVTSLPPNWTRNIWQIIYVHTVVRYFIYQFIFMTQYFIYYMQVWHFSGLCYRSMGCNFYIILLLNQLVNQRSLGQSWNTANCMWTVLNPKIAPDLCHHCVNSWMPVTWNAFSGQRWVEKQREDAVTVDFQFPMFGSYNPRMSPGAGAELPLPTPGWGKTALIFSFFHVSSPSTFHYDAVVRVVTLCRPVAAPPASQPAFERPGHGTICSIPGRARSHGLAMCWRLELEMLQGGQHSSLPNHWFWG